jgi:coenzyme F420-reducing hydrogenase beta subunit
MENRRLPILCEDKDCTGCLACVNSCNFDALIIKINEEGFYRPSLESSKCVGCLQCEKSCPILHAPVRYNKEDIKVFAGWHKDDGIRKQSSSGGAFSAIAQTVLEIGGVVAGAAFTKDLHIEHIIIDNKEDLKKLRLSKYAQSNIGAIFKSIQGFLDKGILVLFVGTACQASGLKGFLKKNYNNLICCDLICHGVPSIVFLQSYLNWISKDYGPVDHINFRNKTKGWYDNLRVIKTQNGKTIPMNGINDAYWVAYSRNSCLQESCYSCKSQGFPRSSDITLADFWRIGHSVPFGHKQEIEKGISMIIVNNPLKLPFIKKAEKYMHLEERSFDEAIAGNQAGIKSCARPKSRDNFYDDLHNLGFEFCRQKYMIPSYKETLVKVFRERLPFGIISFIRLLKQK